MRRTLCLLGVTCGLLIACGLSEGKEQGEAFAERYFVAASMNDANQVLAMYDEAFYKATPESQWRETYTRVRAKLGKPQQHTLTTWNVTNMVGISGSGRYVTLAYQVRYERGNGIETLGIFLPSGGRRAGIRAHNFNSDALLQ